VFFEHVNWDEAKQRCEQRGGQLAVIPDAAAWAFAKNLTQMRVWLGASDEAKEGTWTWVPSVLHGKPEAIVIFTNLPDILAGGASVIREESPLQKEERAGLALRIDQTMREKAPAGWKGEWRSFLR
jgi:Lectin C-type domain